MVQRLIVFSQLTERLEQETHGAGVYILAGPMRHTAAFQFPSMTQVCVCTASKRYQHGMCCRNTHSTRSHAAYSSKLLGLSINVSLLLLIRSCAWEKSWHQYICCGIPSMSSVERMCLVSNSPTTAAGAHIPPGPLLSTAATQTLDS